MLIKIHKILDSKVERMLGGKREAEDFFILVYVVLRILQEFNSSVEIPAFILGSALILWLIYDKIPPSLNRRFPNESRAFTQDLLLKLGLMFFSSSMYTLFALNLNLGYSLLPSSLHGINTLDLTSSFFGWVLLIYISIHYFSWRLWKYPNLAHMLWRIGGTYTEYKKEVERSKKSRLYSIISRYFNPGVIPMAVSALLFFGWLVLSLIDLLMIGFLLIWFIRNLVSGTRLADAFSRWKAIDEGFIWDAITRVGIAGQVSSVFDAVMIFLGFIGIVFPSLMGWSAFIGVMIFFNGWYILFILFQIGLRSIARIRIDKRRRNLEKVTIKSLPKYVDTILLWSFAMMCTFSLAAYLRFHSNKTFAFIFVCLSILLNLSALSTVVYWLKKQERQHRLSEKTDEEILKIHRDLVRDRYRLYSIVFFPGIPVVAAVGSFSSFVFWSGLVGGLVFLGFHDDFRRRVQRKKAGVYASLLTAYMGTGIFIFLGGAVHLMPELKIFTIQVGVLLTVILAIYWLAIFTTKRRWKWN